MDINEQQRRFAEWTSEHGAIVHHVVNGFATGEDRKDLLQEVLLAVWRSIPAFRGQAKPSTYLYRVCHNTGLLWIRTERNYRRRVEHFGESASADFTGDADAPKDRRRLTRLYAAIHRLKPVDRSLILLSLDGLSYREMAEVLGLSESNVGVRLTRIRAQLGKTLKEGDAHDQR